MSNQYKQAKDKIKVGGKIIGVGEPAFFIAEIGNNHNGDYFLAKRSIEEAAKSGADAVKFQKRFVSETFAKELLEKPHTEDQIFGKTYGEYRERLELGKEDFLKLKKHAENLGLVFFATPFDIKSVDFLEDIEVSIYKISSFDVTNLPLIEYIAKKGKPIILSLGMSDLDEIDEAIEAVLKYNNQLIILYCVSIYPTPDESLNLSTISMLKDKYSPIPVGYSGHEKDILPSLISIGLGAKCIERHFTLDKNLPGPDHNSVSIEPKEFQEMIYGARRIERGLGQPIKKLLEGEKKTRAKHTKSIVSNCDIKTGSIITNDMLCFKSPGHGFKPNMINKVIGRKTKKFIPSDTVIKSEFLNND